MEDRFFSLADRPDKVEEVLQFTESIRNRSSQSNFGWPIFEFQSYSGKTYWPRLHQDFAAYQFFMTANDLPIASCFSIPFYWQGDKETLPAGWDKVIESGFLDRSKGINANALSLLAITVAPEYQGRGLSKQIVRQMKAHAIDRQLEYLVAPVRPVLKQFYPLAQIAEYADWKTKEGKVFDPWLRVHLSMGARLVKFAHQSLIIEGTVAEWESWAGMKFPVSGEYVVPGALSTVTVEIETDRVIYHQPNIWLQHELIDSFQET
jgi:GNAT superfamily N-acetyltransferase